ncbi:hypothetical protein [Bacillus chungangensis]|uniref:Lactoylglutathione lyase n=1 Tax=Bacillus chungangensis TaxID=587633 RepID=A0ABT9WRR3_9BACI|nr:hypothetical protein [Bacillus chungangensis]MDQ0175990.1 putative lactoylglutathione lyase [Bacillus chungangensis]
MAKKAEVVKKNTEYTKQQFLASKKFTTIQKDVLNVLLLDEQKYTNDQVKQIMDDFMKKEVN